jgi:hypothetical protein
MKSVGSSSRQSQLFTMKVKGLIHCECHKVMTALILVVFALV